MSRPIFVTTEAYATTNQKLRIIASAAALAAISLFIPTLAFAGQIRTVPREVWIAVRTDGHAGRGTIADPYDGSTQAKFDARLASFGLNTHVHLEPGTFQTAWNHDWVVKDGWCFAGAGINATTVQIVGSLTGHPGTSAAVFVGVYNQNVNGFIAKDLTIDCNWAGLAKSADTGATVRSFTNTMAVSDSAIIPSTNGAFTQLDVGRVISGAGIPANSWIGIVNSATSIGLSSSAVSNVRVKATISNGTTITIAEKNCKVMAAYIYGANNCKFDHVRAIHGYGSVANGLECFALGFAASPLNDASNNVMTHCLVEQWYGNYANPFALAGFRGSPSYPGVVTWMTNSRVEFCTAIGRQGVVGYPTPGSVTPFTSGGVNLADVKNCTIRRNRFEDCQGAAYQDTGGFDGIEVSDNTVIRGFQGVVFDVNPRNFPGALFRNLRIIRNELGIQRRYTKGANYGIIVRNDCSPIIEGNTVTYDATGPGGDVFWPIVVNGTRGTIINNTIDGAEYVKIGDAGVINGAPDSRYTLANNRTSAGGTVAGLADTAVIERVVIPWGRMIGRVKLPLPRKPK